MCTAEVVGTFLLVLFGTGSVAAAVFTGAQVGMGAENNMTSYNPEYDVSADGTPCLSSISRNVLNHRRLARAKAPLPARIERPPSPMITISGCSPPSKLSLRRNHSVSRVSSAITSSIAVLNGQYASDFNLIAAASIMIALPTLLVYLALQKHFIAGLTLGANKG